MAKAFKQTNEYEEQTVGIYSSVIKCQQMHENTSINIIFEHMRQLETIVTISYAIDDDVKQHLFELVLKLNHIKCHFVQISLMNISDIFRFIPIGWH